MKQTQNKRRFKVYYRDKKRLTLYKGQGKIMPTWTKLNWRQVEGSGDKMKNKITAKKNYNKRF